MKVVFFTADSNGGYPVPAVRGGAVSTLIEHLVAENNNKRLLDMTIVSLYDKEAETKSKEYPNVHFIWIHVPIIIRLLDKFFFFIVLHFFKKRKAISYRTIFSLLFYIAKSSFLLKKSRYDKVILENNIPLAWIIRLSKYQGEAWYHLHNIPRTTAKCKSVFEKCKYLCVSEFVARELQTCPIGPINVDNIRVLYNCVDTSLFSRKNSVQEIREKYGIAEDEHLILFVGRLSEEKGIDKLLESIPLLQTDKIKVLIVGSLLSNTNVVDSYQKRIAELSKALNNKVSYTGYINQMELPHIYSAADVAVLPSVWDEPAGLTMVEAMACGTPVITTQSGGIPEYVADCGFVLPIDETLPKNIAEKIDLLLADRSLCSIISEKAVLRVAMNFSSKIYLENLIGNI